MPATRDTGDRATNDGRERPISGPFHTRTGSRTEKRQRGGCSVGPCRFWPMEPGDGRATRRTMRDCSTWTTAGVDDLLQPYAWADLGPDLGRLLRAPHLAAVDVWPAGSASRFGKADSAAESGDVPAANDLARGHSGRPHPGVARDLGIQPMTEACDGFHPFAADGQMTSGRPLSPVRCRLRLCVGRGATLPMPLERADAYRFVIAR